MSYSRYQTSQTGGQQYSDTSPFSIPCLVVSTSLLLHRQYSTGMNRMPPHKINYLSQIVHFQSHFPKDNFHFVCTALFVPLTHTFWPKMNMRIMRIFNYSNCLFIFTPLLLLKGSKGRVRIDETNVFNIDYSNISFHFYLFLLGVGKRMYIVSATLRNSPPSFYSYKMVNLLR